MAWVWADDAGVARSENLIYSQDDTFFEYEFYYLDKNDTVSIRATNYHSFVVDMGSGDDHLTLTDMWTIRAYGGEGHDTIFASANEVRLYGGDGSDSLVAGAFADLLFGDSGYDTLVGGAGDDTVDGGSGNDYLWCETGADEGYGGEGNDTLDGGASGKDTLDGGSGDDDLWGWSSADLLYGGSGNDYLNGGSSGDSMYGGLGNDTMDGETGVDRMVGDLGDDVYQVKDDGDKVIELAGEGKDTIWTNKTFTISANVEQMYMFDSVNINGTGNSLSNGMGGNDGENILNGASGNDTIGGWHGNDTLIGGSGKDVFVFDFKGSADADRVKDFKAADDEIWIQRGVFKDISSGTTKKGLVSDQFHASSSGNAADKEDRILYDTTDGKLYYDRDGTGTNYSKVLFGQVDEHPTLTYADIFVV